MHSSTSSNTPEPRGHSLIYGLDPLCVDHARIILSTPERNSPMRRALAFATVKTARGETIDRKRMIATVMAASRMRVVERPAAHTGGLSA
ncbi:hypothetical protein Q4560_05010 [Celeribacter halophilus]|uniref:hypothetical protein n=1 Tax=Celeribacter halophilus TaxID=576117 RepID=UPI0026E24F58|nr:hypothetical protein [Celeribacter halophilus]MDO6722616.1 hypothetical protein [Celeribacter halophilus]